MIALTSAKGSPGVTTLCIAMACASGRVLVEMDPAGGDLALRAAVPQSPGLSELAVRARRDRGAGIPLGGFTQRLRSGATVVPAPVGAAGVSALLSNGALLPSLAEALRASSTQVLIDAGRFGPHVAALDADRVLLVVVARRDAASLGQAQALLRDLGSFHGRSSRPRIGLALVGRGEFGASEVVRELDVPLLGGVPWHSRHAERLTGSAAVQSPRGNRLVHAAAAIVTAADAYAGIRERAAAAKNPLVAWLSRTQHPQPDRSEAELRQAQLPRTEVSA